MAERADIVHLLRRTEYVDRLERVDELEPMTLEQAVDNVLDVLADPGVPAFYHGADDDWRRTEDLTHFWFDRMAHDSPRPIQEKMAFFWHGHFCSDLTKVARAHLLREQMNVFRHSAFGNVRPMIKTLSRQVAMLRYLDNNQNKATSPNQNFARELLELFLLGVDNYTEADVEAATLAWTGHSDDWETDDYEWRADWHDGSPKQFLGRTINTSGAPEDHGDHTIDVILGGTALGDGVVPVGSNQGRPSKDVAAEFLSRKLWTFFAGTSAPAEVIAALRDVLLANDFEILPWVRTLLLRPEFYTTEVKQGLVRSPVDFVVAALVATGHRSDFATPLWRMEGMGQRPFFPPNVAGWKHNGYFVNASAMGRRIDTARGFGWRSTEGYWDSENGLMRLARGNLTRSWIETDVEGHGKTVLDEMLRLMDLKLGTQSYNALLNYANTARRWERSDMLPLILMTPDVHVA